MEGGEHSDVARLKHLLPTISASEDSTHVKEHVSVNKRETNIDRSEEQALVESVLKERSIQCGGVGLRYEKSHDTSRWRVERPT